jgi:hypothetical protein
MRTGTRIGVWAAAKAPYPADGEISEPDGPAADHVEHIVRSPAGGPGDNGLPARRFHANAERVLGL